MTEREGVLVTSGEVSATSPTVPPLLRRWGALGWSTVGVVLGALAIFLVLRLLSGLIVPVAFALILVVMTLPLTNWLDRHMPRGAAVGLVMILVAAISIGLAWVFIAGVANEAPSIESALQDAAKELQDLFSSSNGTVNTTVSTGVASASHSITTLQGITGFVVTGLDSAVSLFFGVFIGSMVLFLVLLNPKETQGWVTKLLPWPEGQAQRLFTTSGKVILDYYKGCTILAFVNSIPVWLAALGLGIPAAGSVFVVLFVTSYIPYIGAWIGGAFAVLLALGDGGTSEGLIMLAVVLVVNLGLQSVVQPFAFGSTMKVSPLGVFLATLLGSTIAGVFGAIMAAPVMALMTRFGTDVRLPATPAPSRADGAGESPDRG